MGHPLPAHRLPGDAVRPLQRNPRAGFLPLPRQLVHEGRHPRRLVQHREVRTHLALAHPDCILQEGVHPRFRPQQIAPCHLALRLQNGVAQHPEGNDAALGVGCAPLHRELHGKARAGVDLVPCRSENALYQVRCLGVLACDAEHLLEAIHIHPVAGSGLLTAEDLVHPLGIDGSELSALLLDEPVEAVGGVEDRLQHGARHREGDDGVPSVRSLERGEGLGVVDDSRVGCMTHPVRGVDEGEPAGGQSVKGLLHLTVIAPVGAPSLDEELHGYGEDVLLLKAPVHGVLRTRHGDRAVRGRYGDDVFERVHEDPPAHLLP